MEKLNTRERIIKHSVEIFNENAAAFATLMFVLPTLVTMTQLCSMSGEALENPTVACASGFGTFVLELLGLRLLSHFSGTVTKEAPAASYDVEIGEAPEIQVIKYKKSLD